MSQYRAIRIPMRAMYLGAVLILCLTRTLSQTDTLAKPDLGMEVIGDSLVRDTVFPVEEEQWQPDPKKALWFSLAVPGLGQIYNRSWWKTPLIYGGLGVSIWFIRDNNQNYKDFRTAYSESFDPNTDNELVLKYPNQESLRRIRDIYYKRYQLSIIATAAIYLMNGIEAYVDAHLKNFEISDDLSLRWATPQVPTGITGVNMAHTQVLPVIGVAYTLK